MELGLLCKSDLTPRNAGTVLGSRPSCPSLPYFAENLLINLPFAETRQSEKSDFAEWYLNIYSFQSLFPCPIL